MGGESTGNISFYFIGNECRIRKTKPYIMETTIKTFWLIVLITISVSCGNSRLNSDTIEKEETPEALQEKELDFESSGSYGRKYTDLVDELYADLSKSSPELLEIENELDKLSTKSETLKEKLDAFDNKSERYYHSAESKSAQITDSLLRFKIQSIIARSRTQYSDNLAGLNDIVKTIDKQNNGINDHHLVLKILLTLPLIEKYQKGNVPSPKEYQDLILEQSKLIERITKSTPQN